MKKTIIKIIQLIVLAILILSNQSYSKEAETKKYQVPATLPLIECLYQITLPMTGQVQVLGYIKKSFLVIGENIASVKGDKPDIATTGLNVIISRVTDVNNNCSDPNFIGTDMETFRQIVAIEYKVIQKEALLEFVHVSFLGWRQIILNSRPFKQQSPEVESKGITRVQ